MKTRTKLAAGLAVAAGLLLGVLAWASFYMLDYALQPANSRTRDYHYKYRQLFGAYPDTRPWIDSLRQAHALRDTFLTMASGERHHALLIPARRQTRRTAIVVHGYTDNAVAMLFLGYMYHHDLGFNVLLPDLHGHGKSEGREAQMGWNERHDLLQWVGMAASLFADKGQEASIVVHGVSMGGATTMALSGEETPEAVRCFVEDCGYSSVWEEMKVQLKAQFDLPDFPLMYTASMLCKLKYGWSFGEASALNQVKKCRKPMLFIHGEQDTFVPTAMVYDLYNAKLDRKELFVAPGSRHAMSYHDHKAAYTTKVRTFVDRYM